MNKEVIIDGVVYVPKTTVTYEVEYSEKSRFDKWRDEFLDGVATLDLSMKIYNIFTDVTYVKDGDYLRWHSSFTDEQGNFLAFDDWCNAVLEGSLEICLPGIGKKREVILLKAIENYRLDDNIPVVEIKANDNGALII